MVNIDYEEAKRRALLELGINPDEPSTNPVKTLPKSHGDALNNAIAETYQDLDIPLPK